MAGILKEEFSAFGECAVVLEQKNWRDYVGRFSVEIELANQEDVHSAKLGNILPDQIRRLKIFGVVDTGATRLVLPKTAVDQLGLPESGMVRVKFADGRRAERSKVESVRVEIEGRASVFTAVVEPGRTDALIGAIVMEELDLLPDVVAGKLIPRDPQWVLAEIE